MTRWEHDHRSSMFVTFLLIVIVSARCNADGDNVLEVISRRIPTVAEGDALLEFKELMFNESCNAPTMMKLHKIFVWYASYGSNMELQRFLCYIEGGQVVGMKKPCEGSRDRTRPRRMKWETVPYRMFFGRNETKTWGPGGVAFLDFQKNKTHKAHIRLYKISLQQFNDVLKQENDRRHVMTSPLFDVTDLTSIIHNEGYKFVNSLKKGWYRTVLYLGQEHSLPVLTFTCSPSKMEDFESNKLPIRGPSKAYKDIIVKALVDEGKIPLRKAITYIIDSYEKPLNGA